MWFTKPMYYFFCPQTIMSLPEMKMYSTSFYTKITLAKILTIMVIVICASFSSGNIWFLSFNKFKIAKQNKFLFKWHKIL